MSHHRWRTCGLGCPVDPNEHYGSTDHVIGRDLLTKPDEPGNIVVVIFPDNAFKYVSSFQKHLPQLFPKQETEAPAAVKVDPFAAHLQSAIALAEKSPDVINVHEAKRLLDMGIPLIDVRTIEEFAKVRVAEATNVPLAELAKGGTDALPVDRQAPVMAICGVGKRSLYGQLLLKAQGYRDVKSVDGGMNAWTKAELPTTSNS